MRNQEAKIQKILNLLALAPFDHSYWPETLRAIGDVTRSGVVHLMVRDSATGKPIDYRSVDIDPSGWLAAGGFDGSRNPYMAAAFRLKPGEDFGSWDERLVEARRRQPEVDYVFQKNGLPHLWGTKLHGTDDADWFLASLLPSKRGPLNPWGRRLFRKISYATAVAARQSRAIGKDSAHLLGSAMNAVSAPVFVCNFFGRVIAMSHAAERLLQKGHLLRLSGGFLRAGTHRETAHLGHELWMAQQQPKSIDHDSPSIPLSDKSGRIVAKAEVVGLPFDCYDIGLGPSVLVFVKENPMAVFSVPGDAAKLSKAEYDVALSLADGVSLAEIAARRKISLETVRSQSKAIYSKLNVRGQLELVKRFHQLQDGSKH